MPDRACVIGLGASLGDALAIFARAIRSLALRGRVGAISHLYRSAAMGGPAQPAYFNAAVLLQSRLDPRELLGELRRLETVQGRVRTVRWGPRSLDLDLLWIEGQHIDQPDLTVPHPRLAERAFALLPLLDVAPEAREPISGRAYSPMRKKCPGARRPHPRNSAALDGRLAGRVLQFNSLANR